MLVTAVNVRAARSTATPAHGEPQPHDSFTLGTCPSRRELGPRVGRRAARRSGAGLARGAAGFGPDPVRSAVFPCSPAHSTTSGHVLRRRQDERRGPGQPGRTESRPRLAVPLSRLELPRDVGNRRALPSPCRGAPHSSRSCWERSLLEGVLMLRRSGGGFIAPSVQPSLNDGEDCVLLRYRGVSCLRQDIRRPLVEQEHRPTATLALDGEPVRGVLRQLMPAARNQEL